MVGPLIGAAWLNEVTSRCGGVGNCHTPVVRLSHAAAPSRAATASPARAGLDRRRWTIPGMNLSTASPLRDQSNGIDLTSIRRPGRIGRRALRILEERPDLDLGLDAVEQADLAAEEVVGARIGPRPLDRRIVGDAEEQATCQRPGIVDDGGIVERERGL